MFINPRHCSHSHRKTSFIQSPDRSHKQDGLILFHISCNSLRLPSLVGGPLVFYISFFFISFNFNSKYLKHLSQFFFIYYHSITSISYNSPQTTHHDSSSLNRKHSKQHSLIQPPQYNLRNSKHLDGNSNY